MEAKSTVEQIKNKFDQLEKNIILKSFCHEISKRIETYSSLPEDRNINDKEKLKGNIISTDNKFQEVFPNLEKFIEWSNTPNQKVSVLVKRLAKDLCDYFKERFSHLLLEDPDSKILRHRSKLLSALHEKMAHAIEISCDYNLVKLINNIVNGKSINGSQKEIYPGGWFNTYTTLPWFSLLRIKLKEIHADIHSGKIVLKDTSILEEELNRSNHSKNTSEERFAKLEENVSTIPSLEEKFDNLERMLMTAMKTIVTHPEMAEGIAIATLNTLERYENREESATRPSII